MAWVPFHQELREGDKRGLPRAARFIFLELSLLARAGRGVIKLPRGMSDVDAIHDVLGGSRAEVETALPLLLAVPEDEDDPEPMVRIEGPVRSRTLTIVNWARWTYAKEALGASTIRVRHHRAKRRQEKDSAYHAVYARDRGKCRYCGTAERLSLDHVVPLLLGGGDTVTNLVLACTPCNSRKGGRTPGQAGMTLLPVDGGN